MIPQKKELFLEESATAGTLNASLRNILQMSRTFNRTTYEGFLLPVPKPLGWEEVGRNVWAPG